MKLRGFFLFLFLAVTSLCSNSGFCFYLHSHVTPTYDALDPISITEENSGLESIDCIYVINLDKRPERMEHALAQLADRGLRANRVRAVEGGLLPFSLVRKLSGRYPIVLRAGEFGCLLSHISIYKDAYERGYSRIWILEDDFEMEMDVNLIPSLLNDLTEIDPNWDIFYTDVDSRAPDGGYNKPEVIICRPDQPRKSRAFIAERKNVSEDIMRVRARWGCYSYIVSRTGLEKIHHYFSHVYLRMPIDEDLHFIPGIREYSSAQEIVTNPRNAPCSDTRT